MDSRKTDPNSYKEAKEIRKLLKLKDSKVGNVILKANVLEQAKLVNKLDLISHHQKSREVNLTWKKKLLLRKQRSTLTKSKSTSVILIPPSQMPPLLPPIRTKPTNTISRQQIDAGKVAEPPNHVFSTLDGTYVGADGVGFRERNVDCFRREPSEKALLQWKRAIKTTREQIRESRAKLPPLISEEKQLDYEKDPRFVRLIEQLGPNITRRKSDGDVCRKFDDGDDEEELSDFTLETDEHLDENPTY